MAFDADEARRRYQNGVEPYIEVYEAALGAQNSEDVQDALIEKKQDIGVASASDLADRFQDGYESGSTNNATGSGL